MADRQSAQPVELTDAQAEVLTHRARGMDIPEIAQVMQISVNSARDHQHKAVVRLGANTPINAVYIATSLGLIPAAQQGASHVR